MPTHDHDALIATARAALAGGGCPAPEDARAQLRKLRDYREHDLLAELAETYLSQWPEDARIMTFHAQAMIEKGHAMAAGRYLQSALSGPALALHDKIEMLALVGRSEKELSQKALTRGHKDTAKRHFQASYDAYRAAHALDARNAYYPLINAAAIADLARARGIRLDGDPDPFVIAHDVIDILDRDTTGGNWVHATRAEAHIALADWDAVERHLKAYLTDRLMPFEHASTLRQFRDLWRLGTRDPRGKAILALMQAKCLWDNRDNDTDVPAEVLIQSADLPDADDINPEAMLGQGGQRTYCWLLDGMACAQSVASVLNRGRNRIGTSFVIDPARFGLADKVGDRACLMTNFHVLSADGDGSSLSLRSGGQVRFEAATSPEKSDALYKIRDVLFESPLYGGLDCAIFTIDAKATDFAHIAVAPGPDDLPGVDEIPTPRVYLIGYPLGGAMQFSLQDNRLLDHECRHDLAPEDSFRRRVHYFAPTEKGNSGSPVFDDNWQCIALHHGGRKLDPEIGKNGVPRLNGQKGRYSANQGIWIGSIVEAARASAGT